MKKKNLEFILRVITVFHLPDTEISKVKVKVIQLCLTLCDPMNCSLPGSSVQKFSRQWNSPGKDTGEGSSLLQGILPTQGLNSGL